MTTATHRAWCNSHIDDEDGPGFCSRESEPAPTFGVDVTDHVALDLWHPMRPGQDPRSVALLDRAWREAGLLGFSLRRHPELAERQLVRREVALVRAPASSSERTSPAGGRSSAR